MSSKYPIPMHYTTTFAGPAVIVYFGRMEDRCYMIYCTCPDGETARSLASALIDCRLAACVNILPGVISAYRWQGEVEHDEEWLLLIKTSRDRYPDVEREIRTRHPYDVPEIIAVPVEAGLPEYLAWVGTETVGGEDRGS